MKTITVKAQKNAEKAEAIANLKSLIKPGRTVYTVLRHKSASGMSRCISLFISHKGEIQDISFLAARAMGYKMNRDHFGLTVSGCGMDMGFHLVYSLGRTLFPNGFIPARAGKRYGRNGSDVNALDTDGGYALEHSWL